MKELFYLDPEVTYLNHGSFGACPKPIFEDYQKWQLLLEREPVQFITSIGLTELKKSRKALGDFLNCHEDDLVYVTNPSYAGNIVVKSLNLQAGDEILSTNHEYGAMDRTWNYYCKKIGAKYVQQKISLPLNSKEQFVEEFWKGYTPKTKAVFLSHITSATALIFPVKEICQRAKELGLMTIIDGAHAPNHVELNLKELNADVYFGACHKWLLAPKGSSFLYVKKEFQNLFDPLIISWGYEADFPSHSQFIDYHEMQGTRDFSAFLTTPVALDFFKKMNWDLHRENCKKSLQDSYEFMLAELNAKHITQISNEFLGQMACIPIKTNQPQELKKILFERYKIEVPIMPTKLDFDGNSHQVFLRISFQVYNSKNDIEYLVKSLKEIAQNKNLLSL